MHSQGLRTLGLEVGRPLRPHDDAGTLWPLSADTRMSRPLRIVRGMGVGRRIAPYISTLARRRPQWVFAAAMALPWALFSVVGRSQSPWFPALDVAMAAGVGAGIVTGV